MKRELWGTFSVKDAARPGAFVAEVVMYDHLVIPVPPKRSSHDAAATADAERQWTRWTKRGWKPGRANQLVAILGDRATPVQWTRRRRADWRNVFEGAKRSEAAATTMLAQEAAYGATATSLFDLVPDKAKGIVAVAPYTSLERLRTDLAVEPTEAPPKVPDHVLTAVIGQEFLVPEDPDRDDFYLLSEAVDAVNDHDFRAARRALFDARRRFVKKRHTDLPSIETAVEEMTTHLDELHRLVKRRRIWKGVKRGFFFAETVTAVALAPNPVTIGTATMSVGTYTASERLADPRADAGSGLPEAALLLAGQHELGLDLRGRRR